MHKTRSNQLQDLIDAHAYALRRDQHLVADARARFAAFVRRHGVTGVSSVKCPAALIGRRCGFKKADMDACGFCGCFHWDHSQLFLKNGKPAVFIAQPYDAFDADALLIKALERDGLDVAIIGQDESWHFPGETVLVEVTRNVPVVTRLAELAETTIAEPDETRGFEVGDRVAFQPMLHVRERRGVVMAISKAHAMLLVRFDDGVDPPTGLPVGYCRHLDPVEGLGELAEPS